MSTLPSGPPLASTMNSGSPPPRLVGSGGHGVRAVVEWALILASYSVLFFGRHWVGGDGGHRFDALSRLLSQGDLHGPIEDTRYSIIGPLFSAPLWYLGKAWLGDPRLGCAYYNWLLFGVFLAVVARSLKGLLPPSTVRRVLLVLVAGSMFPNHVLGYYAEVFTAVFVAAGVLCVCTQRITWPGWTAIVLGTANTPAVGVGAGLVCLYFVLDRRRVRFVVPVLAIVALFAVEAWLRRGGKSGYEGVGQNPTLMPYSGRPGFSYPLFLGLLSVLFSFGKGIAFYAPGLFAKVDDLLGGKLVLVKTYRAWLLFLAGVIVVYSKFCGWYGGEFWGPRYMLFASVPASFALALNLEVRRSVTRSIATLVMLTLSIWIGADGLVFGQAEMGQCWANGYALEHLCWYVPEFAAWIRPFVVHTALETKDLLCLGVYAAVYAYLAVPIVAFVLRSLLATSAPYIRRAIDWKAWSF
jgi:hypothetical protein